MSQPGRVTPSPPEARTEDLWTREDVLAFFDTPEALADAFLKLRRQAVNLARKAQYEEQRREREDFYRRLG